MWLVPGLLPLVLYKIQFTYCTYWVCELCRLCSHWICMTSKCSSSTSVNRIKSSWYGWNRTSTGLSVICTQRTDSRSTAVLECLYTFERVTVYIRETNQIQLTYYVQWVCEMDARIFEMLSLTVRIEHVSDPQFVEIGSIHLRNSQIVHRWTQSDQAHILYVLSIWMVPSLLLLDLYTFEILSLYIAVPNHIQLTYCTYWECAWSRVCCH